MRKGISKESITGYIAHDIKPTSDITPKRRRFFGGQTSGPMVHTIMISLDEIILIPSSLRKDGTQFRHIVSNHENNNRSNDPAPKENHWPSSAHGERQ